jgi:PIN domain nuclease of toxin-antitoxin system
LATTTERAPALYVLDTHALYWYWSQPSRLGAGADAVFGDLERRTAFALVPWPVVAELHYLTRKRGAPLSAGDILRLIDRAPALRLEALTRRHLRAFDRLETIPEMHDRMIAAVGLVHDAVIVTRDAAIQAHPSVRSVW